MTKNVPALRFPGFRGEWEENRLGDIAKIVGGGTPKTKNQEYWDGEIPWFTPTEIIDNKYVSESDRTISSLGLKESSAKLLPKGTLLLTSRATLGEIAILTKEAATNQGFQSLIVKKANAEFVFYLQPKIKRYCQKYSSGSTFKEINKNTLGKMPIIVPLLQEQEKIATFFSLLDNRIKKQIEKIEQLKQLKKGLMQKIFSQEIRFKDENGNEYPKWVKVELDDCIKYKRNYSFSRASEGEGKYKHIHYGDIHTKLPTVINNTDMIPNIMSEGEFTVVEPGDILVADASEDYEDLGKTVVINFKNSNVVAGSHVHAFSLCNTINPIFYGYFTKTDSYYRYMRKYGTGVSVLGLSKKNLSKIIINIPEVKEQKQIASLFSLLDKRIEKQLGKIEQLKEQKKGLLQKMFV